MLEAIGVLLTWRAYLGGLDFQSYLENVKAFSCIALKSGITQHLFITKIDFLSQKARQNLTPCYLHLKAKRNTASAGRYHYQLNMPIVLFLGSLKAE